MEEQGSNRQIAIKWGLIFGLASTIYTLITTIGRIQLVFIGTAITWGIIITAFVLACKEYKRDNGGFMSFGKGFSMVMLIALIGGLIRTVVYYVYLSMDTEYIEFIKESQRNSPFGPPPEANEQATAMTELFMSPWFFALITFIMAIFGGLILGAIVTAIMKNEEEEF